MIVSTSPPFFLPLERIQNHQRRKIRRMASAPPTAPIEIAKLRSRVDESPCFPEEELDEDVEAVPDVVPVLPLLCDVEEMEKGVVDGVFEGILDGVSEGSRTSKMNISTTANWAPAGMFT